MDEIEEVKALLIAAHERFDAAIEGIDPVALENERAVGVWSPRDVAGHLADWQNEMLRSARHILGGDRPRGHPVRDVEEFNQMNAAVRGAEPWELSKADLDAARENAVSLIESLTPEQLNAVGPFPWGAIGKLRGLVEVMVRHLDEHSAQVEAWRLRRTGARVDS